MSTFAKVSKSMPKSVKVCKICHSLPKYAKVCQNMPKYNKFCQGMQKYAKVCKSMQKYAMVHRSSYNKRTQNYIQVQICRYKTDNMAQYFPPILEYNFKQK